MIGTGIESLYTQVKEYAFGVRLKITNREKETETVLEASRSLISYRAENISGLSNIVQGQYIVNTTNITLNITLEITEKMARLVAPLVQLKGKLPNLEGDLGTLLNVPALRSAEQEVKSIDAEAEPLLHELTGMLSEVTEYQKLQEALGTGGSCGATGGK